MSCEVVIDADVSPYDVTPDGQRFLVLETAEHAAQPLTVIVNWPSLLNKATNTQLLKLSFTSVSELDFPLSKQLNRLTHPFPPNSSATLKSAGSTLLPCVPVGL